LEKARKNQEIGISGYGGGASSICLKGTVTSEKGFKSDLESQLKKGKKLSIKEYLIWREKQ